MYPSPCPAGAARARGHIPGFGEITAAWLLPSSCHHLFPPRPPPAVPVTGRARRARRLCRAGLQRGAGLHCDAGRLSRHLLFSRLLERVCLQTIPPPEEFFIHATCSESGSDRNLLENRLSGAALFSLRGCPAPPPSPQGSEPRFPQKLAFSHPLLPTEESLGGEAAWAGADLPRPASPPRPGGSSGASEGTRKNVKIAVNSTCVPCVVGASEKKEGFLAVCCFFFFFYHLCATLCFPVWMCSRSVLTDTRVPAPLACG